MLGKGDIGMAAAGTNDDLKPTNFTARVLKAFFIDPNYQRFAPDVVVADQLDLAEFGYAGKIMQMSGHTPGSLVVVLSDGRAFVGDMILGGWFGGALFSQSAGEHYFHADLERNRSNIATLLAMPIETFYLGHGGPVSRAAALSRFGISAAPR